MKTGAKAIGIGCGVLTLLGSVSLAGQAVQGRGKPEYLETVSAVVKPDRVMVGGAAFLEVTVRIKQGFHINANKPGDENMIATEFTPSASKPFLVYGKPVYPAARAIGVTYSPKPLNVYEGAPVIRVPITIMKKNATPGKLTVGGSLRIQGCNDTSCYPPATIPVSATLIVNGVR